MEELEIQDPLLDIALEMEEHAKTDEYFIQAKSYTQMLISIVGSSIAPWVSQPICLP